MEHPRLLLKGICWKNPFRKKYKPKLEKLFESFIQGDRRINQLSPEEGQTLLHLAVIENRSDLVEELLNRGADLETKNRWGMTPTHLATLLNHTNLSYNPPENKPSSILIYRNADKKIHTMPISDFEKRLKIDYINQLEFENVNDIIWVVNQCKRKLIRKQLINKDMLPSSSKNKWLLAMHEKSLKKEQKDHFYIKWISSYLGYGVFAAKDLPDLTYIGEYTGVVKKRWFKKNRYNDYIFRYTAGPKETPFVIDAQDKGNFARFINHSNCPNLTCQWVITGGITRIILFTNTFIQKGKQLTYNYGDYYWRSRTPPEQLT